MIQNFAQMSYQTSFSSLFFLLVELKVDFSVHRQDIFAQSPPIYWTKPHFDIPGTA
jgi:hypothetical protein